MGGAQIAAILLTSFVLTAFSPPQSKREPAQQEPPKSWIPERKPETGPPITALVDPPPTTPPQGAPTDKSESKFTHPTGVSCLGQQQPSGPAQAARAFVEAYSGARAAVTEKRFRDALALAEQEAPYARDARQWMAIEGIRIVALAALGDDANLVATLEAMIALNCATPEQATQHQEMLNGARERLKTPSAQ